MRSLRCLTFACVVFLAVCAWRRTIPVDQIYTVAWLGWGVHALNCVVKWSEDL